MKVKSDHRSKFSNLSNWKEEAWKNLNRWSPDFFQASSFQLLKLENLLRWSLFTFIHNRSSNMNYFIYTSQGFPSQVILSHGFQLFRRRYHTRGGDILATKTLLKLLELSTKVKIRVRKFNLFPHFPTWEFRNWKLSKYNLREITLE